MLWYKNISKQKGEKKLRWDWEIIKQVKMKTGQGGWQENWKPLSGKTSGGEKKRMFFLQMKYSYLVKMFWENMFTDETSLNFSTKIPKLLGMELTAYHKRRV